MLPVQSQQLLGLRKKPMRRGCLQDDILMFGGGGGQEMRPQYVLNDWSLATDLMKDFKGTVRTLPPAADW